MGLLDFIRSKLVEPTLEVNPLEVKKIWVPRAVALGIITHEAHKLTFGKAYNQEENYRHVVEGLGCRAWTSILALGVDKNGTPHLASRTGYDYKKMEMIIEAKRKKNPNDEHCEDVLFQTSIAYTDQVSSLFRVVAEKASKIIKEKEIVATAIVYSWEPGNTVAEAWPGLRRITHEEAQKRRNIFNGMRQIDVPPDGMDEMMFTYGERVAGK